MWSRVDDYERFSETANRESDETRLNRFRAIGAVRGLIAGSILITSARRVYRDELHILMRSLLI